MTRMKRINSGIYETTLADGRKIEIERFEDGYWFVFEVVESDATGYRREYWNDYPTKRAAVASLPE